MTIKEIKEAMMGKNISHYCGFNGSLNYFTIGHIAKDGTGVDVFPAKGKGFGIFVPREAINPLLETWKYIKKKEIERCQFEDKWKLW